MLKRELRYINFDFLFESRLFDIYMYFFVLQSWHVFSCFGGLNMEEKRGGAHICPGSIVLMDVKSARRRNRHRWVENCGLCNIQKRGI